jgi:hypothetical protein
MVRPLGRGATWLTLAALAVLATCIAGCGSTVPPPATTGAATSKTAQPAPAHHNKLVSCGTKNGAGSEPTRLSGLFSAQSVWNRPDVGTEPLGDQRLAQELAGEADSEIRTGIGPWIETSESSTPVYVVGPDQRCVPVHLDVTEAYGKSLKSAFARVPLPTDARPAAGSDAHLTLIQPSTDSMWEFWHLRRDGDAWHASWGGAMHNLSASPGYYTSASWPGARSYWGASATSLPVVAGTMTIGELESGHIDHALAISIPNARKGVFAFPAQRTDGTLVTSGAIPEGTTFRLDPKLDIASLHLPPVVAMMAKAAQRYGIIVRDKTLHAIGFYAEDPSPLGTNPYTRIFGGKSPGELLKLFPWPHLQVVKSNLKSDTA